MLSGGLDSILAIKIVQEQGIEVSAVHFVTPFASTDRNNSSAEAARVAINGMGVVIREIFLTDAYLDMIINPRHGYGKNMNPCADCHILMCREAKKVMEEIEAQFVVTGEVVGQRPMSQNRNTLRLVEKESGLQGLLLRPLSAQLLPPTIPEKEGWLDREMLMSFSGRIRRPQIELAESYGIGGYPSPAGGCLLTAKEFSRKVKDLLDYNAMSMHDVELLKVGRHFRLNAETKLIVGRDKRENQRIEELAQASDYIFRPTKANGPSALLRGKYDAEKTTLAAEIVARYCDGNEATYDIVFRLQSSGKSEILTVKPKRNTMLSELRI